MADTSVTEVIGAQLRALEGKVTGGFASIEKRFDRIDDARAANEARIRALEVADEKQGGDLRVLTTRAGIFAATAAALPGVAAAIYMLVTR